MIIFIGCGKRKQTIPCKAKEMYTGTLFILSYKYAKKLGGTIYILSAKHGLLSPEDIISPYNMTLNTFSKKQKINWAKMVYRQMITRKIQFNEEAIFLCGENYSHYLRKIFPNYKDPLSGLTLGKRIKYLKMSEETT